MKSTKRNQPRRAMRTPTRTLGPRDSLEAKLLKICADIGWICGWREERLERTSTVRRSSRKRVMLGRVPTAEAKMREDEAFFPVEATFVSSRRVAYAQTESATEAGGLADFALDLQDELTRLERVGISSSEVAGALGNGRALGRQLWERRRQGLTQ